MLGTGAAQVVSLALLPIISRIYGPNPYGEFSTYLVWVGLIIILATLQLQHALILPKLHAHARLIFRLGLVAIAFVSCAVLVGSLAIFGVWLGRADALALALLMSLAVALGGVGQIAQGYAVRIAAYPSVARAAVARVLVAATVQCLLGMYGFGAKALLLGHIAGDAIALTVMAGSVRARSEKHRKSTHSFSRIIAILRSYRDFPKYGVPQEFVNSLSQGLPVLLLGYGYGPAAAGAYALVARLLGAPVQLIGNATRQVIYRELAQKVRTKPDQLRVFNIVTFALLIPAVVGAGILFPWVSDIAIFLLGSKWDLAGAYSQTMLFWFAVAIANAPATAAFRVARKQELSLYYNISLLLLRLLALWLAILYADSVLAVCIYAAVGVVMNLLYIFLGYRVLSDTVTSTAR